MDFMKEYEKWRRSPALSDDASPMMGTLAALREKYDLHMRAERYVPEEASASEAKFLKT